MDFNEIDSESNGTGSNNQIDNKPKYEFEDIFLPHAIQHLAFDKKKFAAIMEKRGITPEQAKGVWADAHEDLLNRYTQSIELKAQEAEKQAEEARQNEESVKREAVMQRSDGYHLTPEEATAEADRLVQDPNSDYWNDKVSSQRHNKAVAYVNRLRLIAAGKEVTVEGYYSEFLAEQQERMKQAYNTASLNGEGRSSAFGHRAPENIDTSHTDIGDGSKETKSGYGQKIEDVQ